MKYPTFCPNPCCHNHKRASHKQRWYVKNGHYQTRMTGAVQRYTCRHCGKHFSTQTFSLEYFVKRHVPCDYIFKQLKSSAGIRAIARDLKVHHNVITNRISRMSRQAVAIHAKVKGECLFSEDLVADGLESFVASQYFPNNIHILTGKDSQFLYCADYAHIRRKGSMTNVQKRRRQELEEMFRPASQAVVVSFLRLLDETYTLFTSGAKKHITLFTDEKPAYARAIVRHPGIGTLQSDGSFAHVRISSRKARTLRNRLFSVNYLDRQIRKDCADHSRETVQFSRNVNNCMERFYLYGFYHNYRKPYRINGGETRLHAEVAGIHRARINAEWKSFFTRRRFLTRTRLSLSEALVWLRMYVTPLKRSADVCPAYIWH